MAKECAECRKLPRIRIDSETWLCAECFDIWYRLNQGQRV